MPHLRKIRYIILDIGWGKKVPNSSPNGLQREKSDDDEATTSKKKLRSYWQLFEDYTKPRSNSHIAVVELERFIQGSMTLEQFVTKATLLVDEVRYPARQRTGWCVTHSLLEFPMTLYMGRLSRKALA